MKLIVGLGNIGKEYEYTYHNVGFLALDLLADKLSIKLNKKECDSIVGVGSKGGEKIVLAKPTTYMNLSGKAVTQLLGKYGKGDLIVVYDDIDIEKGTIRYREKGSSGTHNGMRSVIASVGTENFQRVRIGIGPVPENIPLVSYVLNTMSDDERHIIADGVRQAVDKLTEIILG